MKNHTFANVIIQDLSSASPLHENFEVSQGIISEVVDGWNKDIYVGDYTMYYDNTMCKQTFSESFSFVIKSYVL